jgi:hypothetical protein
MTKTDIKTLFKNYIVLLVDSNEQKNHIKEYFESKEVRTLQYNMKSADYSFMILPNHLTGNSITYFGKEFLIERKSGKVDQGGGFAELRNNLVSGHKQFKAEFKRIENVNNVFLLIENAKDMEGINLVKRGKMPLETFKRIFNTFILNRNKERLDLNKEAIIPCFCPIENSGEAVMVLIFDFLKEFYK